MNRESETLRSLLETIRHHQFIVIFIGFTLPLVTAGRMSKDEEKSRRKTLEGKFEREGNWDEDIFEGK